MTYPELMLPSDGSWFQVGDGACVDLSSRSKYRTLLKLLVDEHLRDPSATLSMSALIGQLWPGERMRHTVARNRAYVALCALRKWGLAGLVLRTREGYRLDPRLRVRLVDAPLAERAAAFDGALWREATPLARGRPHPC